MKKKNDWNWFEMVPRIQLLWIMVGIFQLKWSVIGSYRVVHEMYKKMTYIEAFIYHRRVEIEAAPIHFQTGEKKVINNSIIHNWCTSGPVISNTPKNRHIINAKQHADAVWIEFNSIQFNWALESVQDL